MNVSHCPELENSNRTKAGTTDQIVHNNRPDRVILDKSIKEAHLLDAAIPCSQQTQQHHQQEALEIYRPNGRANKNLTT
jgi:hypothetical protein